VKPNSLPRIKHLGIVGAGVMGTGIAQIAASAGIDVSLYDINSTLLRQALERLKAAFKLENSPHDQPSETVPDPFNRIHARTRLGELGHSDIVIEAVIEDLRVKKDLFKHVELDTRPGTILATTTSSLSVTAIASGTNHPERVIGLHFSDVPSSTGLVELVRGELTSEETVQRTALFSEQIGKGIVVCTDNPGFILNRLLQSYYVEAMHVLGERIADADQIDRIMELEGGIGTGPFRSMDARGLDVIASTNRLLYERTSGEPRFRPLPQLKSLVESGRLGEKTGQGWRRYTKR
jgi:3-hydroxybutyryl-CoA dehydrogenase